LGERVKPGQARISLYLKEFLLCRKRGVFPWPGKITSEKEGRGPYPLSSRFWWKRNMLVLSRAHIEAERRSLSRAERHNFPERWGRCPPALSPRFW